jgi:ABC-2 type transport system permease protein
MKGLILKDFYVLSKQIKIMFLFIAVFALIPEFSLTAFALVYASLIPLTALAYDERSKWEKVALTMPYTRSQLVISKYVLGFIFALTTALLVLIGNVIHTGELFNISALKELLLVLCFSILIISFILPALFKFGVEKGRILFILVAVLFSAVYVLFSSEEAQILNNLSVITEHYLYLIPICTIVIVFLSILISVSIYIKKSF